MKKHIILRNNSETEKFTNPQGGGNSFVPPERDRNLHSQNLLHQISNIREKASNVEQLLPYQNGYYAEIKSEPEFALNLKSIEADGRELVSVKTVENTQIATVFLDEKALAKLETKVEKYQTEHTKTGKAKNKPLVESISEISLGSLQSLWTDETAFPNENQTVRWEVWLRAGENDEERNRIITIFKEETSKTQLPTSSKEIRFPESTVVLVQATAKQISQILYPLNILSELRKAIDTADFFLGLGRDEEQDWVDDAVSRIEPPHDDAPAVCLLDTGVNYEHPLLKVAMNPTEMDSYNPLWLITDHVGHGTGMAGLSLHNDLTNLLASTHQIPIRHRIESVKIFLNENENPIELYGEITKECVARAEIFAPNRNRVICLAVTSTEHRFRGVPSSWSAMIDELSSACNEENDSKTRLFFISAGNVNPNECVNYPISNFTDQIHNPAQSFNAITVGAYTDKVIIDQHSPDFGNQPLAPKGGLCPFSTTSLTWKDEWANKPDIVMEGGNLVSHPHTPFQTPSLRLLTTNSDWQQRYLTDFGETSAATALASRIGALILAEYPNFRAETVRGLIIHSANWTQQMKNEYPNNNQTDKRNLLRCYGYGIPSLEQALHSANNSVTLIAEDSLQPFIKEGSNNAKVNEMNLHEIPWASDVLIGLGELEVEMRVTLSYFIEPNPNGKGYKDKHRYASHQLRFATNKPDENKNEFRKRINKLANVDNEKSSGGDKGWSLGEKLRHKGSLHSDIWKGTAADLATKNMIAVYPVGGWWKDLKRQQKWDKLAKYSLIVSIKTQETKIDLYTPIQNQIAIPIEV